MQAAWGGNTDTYTNTLCSPQLREHCRSRDEKTGRRGGVLRDCSLPEGALAEHSGLMVAVVTTAAGHQARQNSFIGGLDDLQVPPLAEELIVVAGCFGA